MLSGHTGSMVLKERVLITDRIMVVQSPVHRKAGG